MKNKCSDKIIVAAGGAKIFSGLKTLAALAAKNFFGALSVALNDIFFYNFTHDPHHHLGFRLRSPEFLFFSPNFSHNWYLSFPPLFRKISSK